MKILVADDDFASRRMVESMLRKWGYEVEATSDGERAWEAMNGPSPPNMAILDWVMPGMDGAEICRQLRDTDLSPKPYIILLTVKTTTEDLIEGLESGANDYIRKPFDRGELLARVRVGARVAELEDALRRRVAELENALTHIKTLQGILPICMYCHKIRADEESWHRIEDYLYSHADIEFSHGMCPECAAKYGLEGP